MVASLDVDGNTTMGECETHDIHSSHNGNRINYADVPIIALTKSTIELNKTLRSRKLLQSPQGLSRDYRGLCDLMGIQLCTPSGDDWIVKLFQEWRKTKPQDSNVATFLDYLERIDRYDVYEDTITLIKEDCCKYVAIDALAAGRKRELPAENALTVEDCWSMQNGYGLAQYDVILLYNEESGTDSAVAADIFQRFTSEFGFVVCNMANSFLPSGQFEYAQFENVIKRCKSIFLFISEAMRNNTLLTYLASYTKATSIVKAENQKIVPILVQNMSAEEFDCPITSIMLTTKMKYFLHQSYGTMDDFWNKLILKVDPYHPIAEPPAHLMPRLQRSVGRTSPVMLPCTDNPPACLGACHQAASRTNQPPVETMQAGTSRDYHPVSVTIGNDIPDDKGTKSDAKKKKNSNFTKAFAKLEKMVNPRKKTPKRRHSHSSSDDN